MNMAMLKKVNGPEKIAVTEHARLRLFERGIKLLDIVRCIETGEIVERYDDDKPFPSCCALPEKTDTKEAKKTE